MSPGRRKAFTCVIVGIVIGAFGKIFGVWELAVAATVLMVGGGVAVALSYRSEFGHTPSGSSAAFYVRGAANELHRTRFRGSLRPTNEGGGARPEDLKLVRYAAQVHEVLLECNTLLARPPGDVETTELDAAREQLVLLVASRLYGPALERKMIDEETVRAVSLRLAAHPSAPTSD
jgi:hypothetical protein